MTSLLDEGTRNLSASEFKEVMKLNGMKLNISSQKDKIEGSFQVITSQVSEGFKLFYEALNHPRFDDSEIQKVRKQIISSIKIDQSNIPTIASNLFNKNTVAIIGNIISKVIGFVTMHNPLNTLARIAYFKKFAFWKFNLRKKNQDSVVKIARVKSARTYVE